MFCDNFKRNELIPREMTSFVNFYHDRGSLARNMDNKKIGERLLRIRQDRKLSQTDFAAAIGVSQSAYNNYERGDRDIPSYLLLEIFIKFEIDPIFILTGEGSHAGYIPELMIASGKAVESAITDSGVEFDASQKWEMINFVYLQAVREGAVNQLLISTLLSIGGKKS